MIPFFFYFYCPLTLRLKIVIYPIWDSYPVPTCCWDHLTLKISLDLGILRFSSSHLVFSHETIQVVIEMLPSPVC